MKNFILTASLLLSTILASNMKSQVQPFIGQIAFVPFTHAPIGWHECDGSTLQISQNPILFSLIGTLYGGNGTTDFALPDARGRVIISNGTSSLGSIYQIGETGGEEFVTLQTSQIPAHTHTVHASSEEGNLNNPNGGIPADTKSLDREYTNTAPNTTMSPAMIGATGGNEPHENRQPYITLKCIIATQGIYPTFN